MPRQITRVEIRKVPMRGAATRGVSVAQNERGAAFLETAVTLPIVLMICVGVFEFGRKCSTRRSRVRCMRCRTRPPLCLKRPGSRASPSVGGLYSPGQGRRYPPAKSPPSVNEFLWHPPCTSG